MFSADDEIEPLPLDEQAINYFNIAARETLSGKSWPFKYRVGWRESLASVRRALRRFYEFGPRQTEDDLIWCSKVRFFRSGYFATIAPTEAAPTSRSKIEFEYICQPLGRVMRQAVSMEDNGLRENWLEAAIMAGHTAAKRTLLTIPRLA